MIKISDREAYPFILEKMKDKCLLAGSLEDDIKSFMSHDKHECYFADDYSCFICVSYLDNFVFIPYTWRDNSRTSLKKLVKFAKSLYTRYTINKDIPILYSGLKNFYPNHSVEIADSIWKLIIRG